MKRYTGLRVIAAFFIMWILLFLFNQSSGPSGEWFTWSNINPLTAIDGLLFFLAFGFGVPIFWSVIITIFLVCLLFLSIYSLLNTVIQWVVYMKKRRKLD